MMCQKMYPLLSPYIDNELGFEEREQVEAHIHSCERCFHEYLQLREDSQRLDEAFLPLRPLKHQFTNHTSALVAEREPTHQPAPPRVQGWLGRLALPVSASALASAAATLLVVSQTSAPAPPAGRAAGEQEIATSTARPLDPPRTPRMSIVTAGSPGESGSRPEVDEADGASEIAAPDPEATEGSKEPHGFLVQRPTKSVEEMIEQLVLAASRNDLTETQALAEQLLALGELSARIAADLRLRLDIEENPDARAALAAVFARIVDPSMPAVLADLLSREESVPVRRELMMGLVSNPSQDSVDLLAQILRSEHEDYQVKINAIQALGVISTREALEVLRSIPLHDIHESVRIEAIMTMSQIGVLLDDLSIVDLLVEVAQKEEAFDVQESAVKALESMPDLPRVQQALEMLGNAAPRAAIKSKARQIYLKKTRTDGE